MSLANGEATKFDSGVKFDTGKPDFSLLPPECLYELIKAYEVGVAKYERDNWRKGMDWSKVYSALQRHANKWWGGELRDEDGQLHLSAVAWCAFTLMWYEMNNIGNDNRFKKM